MLTARDREAQRLGAIILIAAVTFSSTGCTRQRGKPGGPETFAPAVSSDTELRSRLEYIASTGVTGSGLAGLPESFANHAKKTELMADYKKLEAAGSPDQAKSIAKKMLEKL